MSSVKWPIVLVLLLLSAVLVNAQDDDPLKIDSSIVRLNVGVVDQHGRPITDLDRSNFKIFEDGVKQDIIRFEPSRAPFSVVMILDMSGSTLPMRQVMKMSAFRFLDALSPEDRVAVVEFYDKINLRNDFTTDRRVIANSINVSNGRGKTQFYKALDFSLDKLAREGNRRKAIIVLSDGVDTSLQDIDRETLSKVADSGVPSAIKPAENDILRRILNKADLLGVTIYPLALPTGDPSKLADPTVRQVEMYKAARERLQTVADRTGGTLHAINRLEDMGGIYAVVAAEIRTLYTIEYQSQNEKHDGKWREVSIRVDNPNLISRTRPGYFAR
jgi:Ca-activated chloride channel family protein